MPCQEFAGATVCSPPQGVHARCMEYCYSCCKTRRHIRTFGGLWYDDTWTCCTCGRSTAYYGKSKARRLAMRDEARQRWATAMTPKQFREHVLAELTAERETMEAIEKATPSGLEGVGSTP